MAYQWLRLGALGVSLACFLPATFAANTQATEVPNRVPVSSDNFRNNSAEFRFVVVGDRTGGHIPGVFREAMKEINWLYPDFVINIGDLVEGYTKDMKKVSREWHKIDGYISTLDMPFFYVVGNHDMGNKVMRKYWLKHKGATYYYFIYKNVLFIALNTEDPPIPMPEGMAAKFRAYQKAIKKGPDALKALMANSNTKKWKAAAAKLDVVHISDDQVAYVRKVLEEHPDVRWTFVLMHKPAWKYDAPNFDKIEALLEGRHYTVFAGHYHYYGHTTRNGHDYIDMATTGASPAFNRTGPGIMTHVMLVTMTKTDRALPTLLWAVCLGFAVRLLTSLQVDLTRGGRRGAAGAATHQ